MVIGTRANKVPRRNGDHWDELSRQMSFLRRSCAMYDAGEYDEAIRIALVIRVLLHDTQQSTSLLARMRIKDTLNYIDTGIYRERFDAALDTWLRDTQPSFRMVAKTPTDVGLVELGDAGGGRVGWYAPLKLRRFAEGSPPDLARKGTSSFAEWWGDPLVETSKNSTFSRSNLVLIMANQDGGGHADEALDADYQDLIEDPLLHMEYGIGSNLQENRDISPALHNIAYASVRQIAFELIVTIERMLHIRKNPGVLLQVRPFEALELPVPPHKVIYFPSPIVLAKI